MTKSVIIIGSGVGGAGIGALLAHEGFNVKLFEKNKLIGGRFSSYKTEDGWNLDVGCHLIANCEKGTIGEILRVCEEPDEKIQWKYARKPGPKFFYNGEFISLPRDMVKFNFGQKSIGPLMKFYDDVVKTKQDRIEELMYTSIHDFVASYTSDPKVGAMLAYYCGLYFVTDQETSAGEWIYCQQDLMKNRSSGFPQGGTIAVPKAYCDIIKEHGGEVYTDVPVEKILIENNIAKGVKLKDGRNIEADIIISNVGIKDLVLKLVGEEHFEPDFIQKIKTYKYSLATLMLKIALDKKITEENMIMYLSFDQIVNEAKRLNLIPGSENMSDEEFMEHVSFDTITKARGSPEFKDYVPPKHFAVFLPIVSNLDPTSAPEEKQLIFAGSGAPASNEEILNYDKWADSIMNSVKDIFPNIEDHIIWTKITTPQDINSFAGKFGNVIGIGQTIDQVGKNRPPQELPGIKNIYECSADTGSHGIGGELAADSALRLYNKLTGKKIPLFEAKNKQ